MFRDENDCQIFNRTNERDRPLGLEGILPARCGKDLDMMQLLGRDE